MGLSGAIAEELCDRSEILNKFMHMLIEYQIFKSMCFL